ncbi:MAG TPA: hypothetical protein VMH03_03550, partial [Terriglobales bacterium]|nr:hypothetical protein [Terriglobales bacterium]
MGIPYSRSVTRLQLPRCGLPQIWAESQRFSAAGNIFLSVDPLLHGISKCNDRAGRVTDLRAECTAGGTASGNAV